MWAMGGRSLSSFFTTRIAANIYSGHNHPGAKVRLINSCQQNTRKAFRDADGRSNPDALHEPHSEALARRGAAGHSVHFRFHLHLWLGVRRPPPDSAKPEPAMESPGLPVHASAMGVDVRAAWTLLPASTLALVPDQ